ncbi:ABC transporter, solute-binding protein [Winkia neuii]|uniref:ABC transporter substrate-binding protein n=1 Tax=Winkia neuii TaxID=33007 RepID=UPI0007642043|nr:sugar ABC transporter substrate-binding protein [Winkia neuii]KWZ74119.1 ABC transporter, solute-binding protein [Winkia neuii]
MNKQRKGVLALALGTISALLLAGCAGANVGERGKTTINYWLWDSAQLPGYTACEKAFEKENPTIDVRINQYGWDDYWTQITASMVAETAPDVFVNHTQQMPKYQQLGQILDVSERVKKDGVNLSAYQNGLVDLFKGKEGKGLYGLPKDWDTEGLFYNETYLKDAGYTPADLWNLTWNPKDGGTFEKFLAHMSVDKNGVRGDEEGFDPKHVDVYGLGYNESGAGYGQVQWSTFALANGWRYNADEAEAGKWITKWNYDSPQLAETINWWKGLIAKGYMPPLAAATSGVGTIESLSGGKYATLIEGAWQNASIKPKMEKWGVNVAPAPIGPHGYRASVMNGVGDSIFAGTKHPNEAWQWVKFMGTPKCQNLVAKQAVVFPSLKESSQKAIEAVSKLGYDANAYSTYLKDNGRAVPSPVTARWDQLQTIMQPAMDAVVGGSKPTESLKEANKQVNALFNK